MPHAVPQGLYEEDLEKYDSVVGGLLRKGRTIKTRGIEPSISRADIQDELHQFDGLVASATVEVALRRNFYNILATRGMEDPTFVDMWSLLDVCLILSDDEICEVGLTFWLIEELLESQVIDNCRRVFDYLELRREAMVARHMNTKKLIILRACNELLKRLSRAEDTVFCGRVFIYLFESLAFGDRSAVNLRGEFHTDNVTSYERTDTVIEKAPIETQANPGPENEELKEGMSKTDSPSNEVATSELYSLFWSLQQYFCKPTALFDSSSLNAFKKGLKATLSKFKEIQTEHDARGGPAVTEDARTKSKRTWEESNSSNDMFNPKYLTSRDLFELEINDLAFRRHIMVQGLILMDFLLCQTPKAKRKLEALKNKSVIYSFTLSDEDAKWVERMRSDIAAYLQEGAEGKFYYRMVDTVLSRDKNWVFWKAESCPSFSRRSVNVEQFVEAQEGVRKSSTSKRLRPTPMGAIDLGFLDEDAENGLAKLASPDRYRVPTALDYQGGIMDDEMDIDMAKTEDDKKAALEAKSSKVWRTLRIASRSKFKDFDKIDDGKNLDVLFRAPATGEEDTSHDDAGEVSTDKADAESKMDTEETSHATKAGEGHQEDARPVEELAIEGTVT